MVTVIRFIKTCWKWRDTPIEHLIEIHELTVMAARRCAYDLKHASAEIENQGGSRYNTDYESAAHHWLDIFNCANSGKEYRHRLHRIISERDHTIRLYHDWFEKHKEFRDPCPDVPF